MLLHRELICVCIRMMSARDVPTSCGPSPLAGNATLDVLPLDLSGTQRAVVGDTLEIRVSFILYISVLCA